jgi:hypothetical protein
MMLGARPSGGAADHRGSGDERGQGRAWSRLLRARRRARRRVAQWLPHRSGRLKSAEGAIEFSAPNSTIRAGPFRSRIREIVGGRTESLEALAVEM